MTDTLKSFKDLLEKINYYNQATSLFYWDMKTKTPKEGLQLVEDASAFFGTKAFELSTSKEYGELLEKLNEPDEFEKLDDTWKFIVAKMKKDYDKDKNVPADFYEEYLRDASASENAWVEAKLTNNYALFAPHLEKVIENVKKMAGYTDPGKDVYEALLDRFEEGMDSVTITKLFDDLKTELVPLVKAILAKPEPDSSIFAGEYDKYAEEKLQNFLLNYIGFDFNRGTFAESEHPFTMNFSSKDARVTNHYHEDDAIDPIFSAIHEGGHAIFEQNVKPEYDQTVAGSCCFMGIHESQSRFYENVLGRNINFWAPIYGEVQKLIPNFKDITLEQFYREINHIKASFIRTAADELTYCFHIIIRFEIEQAIFNDNVPVSELPALWNKKMEEYLGIVPQTDTEGILQDTHWSDGSFGYFPSYLLGSIYDGMFLEKIEEDLGDVNTILKEGRIKDITKWLNENIHQYGSTRKPKEVIKAVCGKEVSAEPIIRYFKNKYKELYNL